MGREIGYGVAGQSPGWRLKQWGFRGKKGQKRGEVATDPRFPVSWRLESSSGATMTTLTYCSEKGYGQPPAPPAIVESPATLFDWRLAGLTGLARRASGVPRGTCRDILGHFMSHARRGITTYDDTNVHMRGGRCWKITTYVNATTRRGANVPEKCPYLPSDGRCGPRRYDRRAFTKIRGKVISQPLRSKNGAISMIVVPGFRKTLLLSALLPSSAAGHAPRRPCLTPTFACRV